MSGCVTGTVVADLLADMEGFAYIATPYSRYENGLDAAANAAAIATAKLMRRGIRCYSPIAHGHTVTVAGKLAALDAEFWQHHDKPFVDTASVCIVIMLDGWRESAGVQHEIEEFDKAGKPVFYADPDDV